MLVRGVARLPGKHCVFLGKRDSKNWSLESGRHDETHTFGTFAQIWISLFGRVGLDPTL